MNERITCIFVLLTIFVVLPVTVGLVLRNCNTEVIDSKPGIVVSKIDGMTTEYAKPYRKERKEIPDKKPADWTQDTVGSDLFAALMIFTCMGF